jgi:AraC-like DNA-binding protein
MFTQSSPKPVMHGAYVNLLLAGVSDNPDAVRYALNYSGITPAVRDDPAVRVTAGQFSKLMTILTAITGDELTRLGDAPIKPGTFATLCRILVLGPSLGTALRLAGDFYHSVTDEFSVHLDQSGEDVSIVVVTRPVEDDRGFMLHSNVMFFAYGLACWLVGRRIPLRTLEVAFPERAGTAYASQVFRASRIQYGCGASSHLTFDASWLNNPIVADDRRTEDFIAALPEVLLLGYRDFRTTGEQLRVLLRRQVTSSPDMDQAAQQLGVSQQTLRRQLRHENLTYQEIKDEVRFGVAAELLDDPTVSVEQVGLKLGFAELSSFHRAFKRWSGCAPGEHRRRRASTSRT